MRARRFDAKGNTVEKDVQISINRTNGNVYIYIEGRTVRRYVMTEEDFGTMVAQKSMT